MDRPLIRIKPWRRLLPPRRHPSRDFFQIIGAGGACLPPFVGERFAGEVTLSSIQRGPFQSAFVGYWIDEALAGMGLVPEAVVVTLRFAFEAISLHRVEISIIPRNHASRRVVEKLGIREEGVALRFLEIDGVWEDHVRYGITAEEWAEREADLVAEWLAD